MDTASYLIQESPAVPRRIPLPLRLRVLFGGLRSIYGWLFFIFGLLITIGVFTFSEAS